jgi:hypothetical protein
MRGKLMDRFEFDSIVVVVVDSFLGSCSMKMQSFI